MVVLGAQGPGPSGHSIRPVAGKTGNDRGRTVMNWKDRGARQAARGRSESHHHRGPLGGRGWLAGRHPKPQLLEQQILAHKPKQ